MSSPKRRIETDVSEAARGRRGIFRIGIGQLMGRYSGRIIGHEVSSYRKHFAKNADAERVLGCTFRARHRQSYLQVLLRPVPVGKSLIDWMSG